MTKSTRPASMGMVAFLQKVTGNVGPAWRFRARGAILWGVTPRWRTSFLSGHPPVLRVGLHTCPTDMSSQGHQLLGRNGVGSRRACWGPNYRHRMGWRNEEPI